MKKVISFIIMMSIICCLIPNGYVLAYVNPQVAVSDNFDNSSLVEQGYETLKEYEPNCRFCYAYDYDGDGQQEGYALSGRWEEGIVNGKLWFIDSDGTYNIVKDGIYCNDAVIEPVLVYAGNQIFLVQNQIQNGRVISIICGCRDGKAYFPIISEQVTDFHSEQGHHYAYNLINNSNVEYFYDEKTGEFVSGNSDIKDIMSENNWANLSLILERWYGGDCDFYNHFQLAYDFVMRQLFYSSDIHIENDPKNLLNYSCSFNANIIDYVLKTNFNMSDDLIEKLHSDIYSDQYGNVGYYHDNYYYFIMPEGALEGSLYSVDIIEQKDNVYKIKFVNNDFSSYGIDDPSLRSTYYCIFEVVNNSQGESFKIHGISNYDDIKWPIKEIKEDTTDDTTTTFGSQVSEWAKEEVEEAYDKNLVPEVLVGKDLTQKVDRAEFAAIAVALYENLSGNKATKASNPFNDISGNACENEILKAYNLDITTGTSATTFEPTTNITREQMATMLTRAYKKSEFEDWSLAVDDEYPLNFMGVKKFADDDQISDYAKESVYFMAKWDIIQGVGDNKFAPKNTATLGEAYGYATREQAVIIALRSAKHL